MGPCVTLRRDEEKMAKDGAQLQRQLDQDQTMTLLLQRCQQTRYYGTVAEFGAWPLPAEKRGPSRVSDLTARENQFGVA